jgi:hypothetical protein
MLYDVLRSCAQRNPQIAALRSIAPVATSRRFPCEAVFNSASIPGAS